MPSPPPGYFWRWSDDYTSLEWEDGTTISLWVGMEVLLNGLKDDGLPPLGSILLIHLACSWKFEEVWPTLELALQSHASSQMDYDSVDILLENIRAGLAHINALPEDLRTGLPPKMALIRTFYENIFTKMLPQTAQQILWELTLQGPIGLKNETPDLGCGPRCIRDLKSLHAAFEKMNFATLEQRLRTGVDSPDFHPAEIPLLPPLLPTAESPPRYLLELLETQPGELAMLAAISRRVVAMIGISRAMHQRMDLPVGGVSDITNRGSLDKLLLSELAWDDLTMSARLAQNEAMYLRRESPPDQPPSQRCIFLDSGIRLWGLPRLYALAVALGLQHQSRSQSEDVQLHRREDDHFESLSLESIGDVRLHLAEISASVSPSDALRSVPAMLKAITARMDVFFITDDRSAGEPSTAQVLYQITRAISELGGRFYVVQVSRNGDLKLHQHSIAGQRLIVDGRLTAEQILRPPPSPQLPQSALVHPALVPLRFYNQFPLPLRFPALPRSAREVSQEGNAIRGIDTQGRLMRWHGHSAVATELCATVPAGRDYHVSELEGDLLCVIASGKHPGDRCQATTVCLKTGKSETVRLESSHPFPLQYKVQSGAAILVYSHKAEACSLQHGRVMSSLRFVGKHGLPASSLIFDGSTLKSDPGPKPPPQPNDLEKIGLPQGRLELLPPPKEILIKPGPPFYMVLLWETEAYAFSIGDCRFFPVTPPERGNRIPFESVPTPPDHPNLLLARIRPECTAFWDLQRSLLHLQGFGEEISILALRDQPSALWTAADEFHGDAKFHLEGATIAKSGLRALNRVRDGLVRFMS